MSGQHTNRYRRNAFLLCQEPSVCGLTHHSAGPAQKAAQADEFKRYTQTCADSTEVFVIFVDSQDLIAKTAHHLHQCDYMAATVYTRSAFEKLIRKHCEDRSKKLVFKSPIGKIMPTSS